MDRTLMHVGLQMGQMQFDCGALIGVWTRQTSEFIFLFILYSYHVVSSEFLHTGLTWSREPGKVIVGCVFAIVWSVWNSLMAYTRDQLINFRTTGVLTVPRPVRKTLFRLHLWNLRRHTCAEDPWPTAGGRVHERPVTGDSRRGRLLRSCGANYVRRPVAGGRGLEDSDWRFARNRPIARHACRSSF